MVLRLFLIWRITYNDEHLPLATSWNIWDLHVYADVRKTAAQKGKKK
jgi:hypothetical protein